LYQPSPERPQVSSWITLREPLVLAQNRLSQLNATMTLYKAQGGAATAS